ncbi:restriction endonuclease subunit S [Carnobacterium divergens]|uniref:restriction endonuclease subunit S n=1 Tax=Carnobacterium divergens TaxID=2748 RepID=UPI00307B963E
MSEIGAIIGGGTPKTNIDAYWVDGDIPWVSPADLTNYKKKYISQGRKSITQLGLEKSSARLMDTGAVLFSSRAPIGYVVIAENPISTNQGFKSVVPHVIEMNEYIYYYFFAFIDDIKSRSSGTTFKEISGRELGNSLFPMPPLNEQKCIVAKIKEIFTVIDKIGTRKEEALTIIKNMRQTALQDAIMGVLVEQDETDEPASILYEQIQDEKERLIKAGKTKKGKPLPDIEKNEIPFEIPENWKWVRLGNLLSVSSGKNLTLNKMKPGPYPVYGGNGITGYHNEFNATGTNILIGRVGAKCGNVNLVSGDIWVTDNAFISSFSEENISSKFLAFLIESMNLRDFAKSTAQPVISGQGIYPLLVPLPPLKEQHRIVKTLDEIMTICDQMEAILDGYYEMDEALKITKE